MKRTDHGLPLPTVHGVREVHPHCDSFVLIAPDPMAGARHRYSCIRVYTTGEAQCIGRELPLKLARAVAMRPAEEDGTAL